MKQFTLGFVIASILWLTVVVLESKGALNLFGSEGASEQEPQVVTKEEEDEPAKDTKKKRHPKRRPRRGRGGNQSEWHDGPSYETGDGEVGDDLGAGDRELGMDGRANEEQLSEAVIDKGIDRVFRGIERCLVLVPSDAPTEGRVVLGMYIAPTGNVTKVNLKGPNALIKGECGACIQQKVKSIRYPSFDGPDMVVHYPITFE